MSSVNSLEYVKVSEDEINRAIVDKGIMSIDHLNSGRKLIILNLKFFVSGEFPPQDLQKAFIFLLEKLSDEERGKQISILFNFQVQFKQAQLG